MNFNFQFHLDLQGEGDHASLINIIDPSFTDGYSVLKSFIFRHDDNTKDDDIRGTIAEMIKEDYDDEFEEFQEYEVLEIIGYTEESSYIKITKIGKFI